MKLDHNHIEWSRELFAKMAEGGTWTVPRSGLVFRKCGNKLLLQERKPTALTTARISQAELQRRQNEDLVIIKLYFEAAGVDAQWETTAHSRLSLGENNALLFGSQKVKVTNN